MSATSQISVANNADTAVTAVSLCKNIRVTENRGNGTFPTADFLVKKPSAGATAVRIQSGSHYVFNTVLGFFLPGQIVGYLRTVSGTATFDQDEDTI